MGRGSDAAHLLSRDLSRLHIALIRNEDLIHVDVGVLRPVAFPRECERDRREARKHSCPRACTCWICAIQFRIELNDAFEQRGEGTEKGASARAGVSVLPWGDALRSATSYTSRIPCAPRKYEVVIVRKRSWPAVSLHARRSELEDDVRAARARSHQICNLIRLPSSSMFLILKSMPIVVMNVGENDWLA